MSRDVDESLIEQTIRRIEEQKAARGLGSARDEAPDDAPAPPAEGAPAAAADDDLIEQTIRRVAEQKAARESGSEPPAEAVEEPLRDIEPAEADPPVPAVAAAALEEEDPIEATIRRVAAQRAARAQEEDDWDTPPVKAPISARIDDDEPPALRVLQGGRGQALAAQPAPHVEPSLDATVQHLAALVARLDHILPTLERLAGSPGNGAPPTPAWNQVARPQPAAPPRPDIFKDSPQSAGGDQIDTRPLPRPLPPLQAEKRGLDSLPRSYRITVEDKRRGVDLVPLHRALLGMDGVRDMSLLSYNNGIAIVSLETTVDIDPEKLRAVVAHAMAREARVEQHNELTMVVKLAED